MLSHSSSAEGSIGDITAATMESTLGASEADCFRPVLALFVIVEKGYEDCSQNSNCLKHSTKRAKEHVGYLSAACVTNKTHIKLT